MTVLLTMTLSAAVATAAALAASKSLAETPLAVGSRGDSVWCTFRNFFSVTFILVARECGGPCAGDDGRQSVRAALLLLHTAMMATTTPFGSLHSLVADLLFTPLGLSNGSAQTDRTGLFFAPFARFGRALDYLLTFPNTRTTTARHSPLIGAVQHTHSNHTTEAHWNARNRSLCL